MKNPIKDNRIVSGMTFAIRFRDFIRNTQVCDACSEEEKEYLLMVAQQLLDYQIETATEQSELDYLDRIKDLIYDIRRTKNSGRENRKASKES